MAKTLPRARVTRSRAKTPSKNTGGSQRGIFDPSLLVPPSNILLQTIADSAGTTIMLTKHMFDTIHGNSKDNLRLLMKMWGATEEEIDSLISYKESEYEGGNTMLLLKEKKGLEIVGLDKITEKIKTHKIIPLLRASGISNYALLNFISDEICLELQSRGKPIICTEKETTGRKILEIIKRIGAKTRLRSAGRVERKYSFLVEEWMGVLADSVGLASLYLFVSPLNAIIHHGFGLVHCVVACPRLGETVTYE